MSKLTRVIQKIFGKNADVNKIAVMGSKKANNPEFSKDVNEIQKLENFENADIQIGKNSPAMEEENAFNYIVNHNLAYIFQEGISEWHSSTLYFSNSIVKYPSTNLLYLSLTNNNSSNLPVLYSSSSAWKFLCDFEKLQQLKYYSEIFYNSQNVVRHPCSGFYYFVSSENNNQNKLPEDCYNYTNSWEPVCYLNDFHDIDAEEDREKIIQQFSKEIDFLNYAGEYTYSVALTVLHSCGIFRNKFYLFYSSVVRVIDLDSFTFSPAYTLSVPTFYYSFSKYTNSIFIKPNYFLCGYYSDVFLFFNCYSENFFFATLSNLPSEILNSKFFIRDDISYIQTSNNFFSLYFSNNNFVVNNYSISSFIFSLYSNPVFDITKVKDKFYLYVSTLTRTNFVSSTLYFPYMIFSTENFYSFSLLYSSIFYFVSSSNTWTQGTIFLYKHQYKNDFYIYRNLYFRINVDLYAQRVREDLVRNLNNEEFLNTLLSTSISNSTRISNFLFLTNSNSRILFCGNLYYNNYFKKDFYSISTGVFFNYKNILIACYHYPFVVKFLVLGRKIPYENFSKNNYVFYK